MPQVVLGQLLDRNKIVPFYRERINGELDSLPPISVELHWTSNCNYDCVHCSYGSRRKTANYLREDTVGKLIDNIIDFGCKAVYLSGGGEPTVLKGWDQHAAKLMDSGIEVALITNGVAVKEKHLPTVERMNYVAVSVYSTMKDRYEKITESNFFADQFSLPAMIKKNSSKTIVGARCVLNDINFDEVDLIYEAAMESGFDYIIFIPAVDYEGRGVALAQASAEKIREIIQGNIDVFDFDKTNVQKLVGRDVKHYEGDDYRSHLPAPASGCKAIRIRSGVFVNYDGGVYLCQPDIGRKELEIGNLNDLDFKDIWNSGRHKQVIQVLHESYDEGSCKNCRSIAFNRAMYEDDAGLKAQAELTNDPFL